MANTPTATGAHGAARGDGNPFQDPPQSGVESDSDATSVSSGPNENIASQSEKPKTKKERLFHHCGRFWLWYLVGAVILAAILLPILYVSSHICT